ncbi:YecA family protein [Oceanobacillus timonensis]|uniref:YecA family protein n=1 Tax=Oceanobacillus timonensis TaxID=1926285 RepID=UPI0009BB8371|nr:SEC-C domain-containing protein [Oceanobacillus timonensis]
MAVKRNDPCPCGSGKKYKKCCMAKDNLTELKVVKEDRFFQLKEVLVGKLDDFIYSKISQSAYFPLESQFKKRTKHMFDESGRGLFHFWLYFFHRYENGLRGIEWFVSEMKDRLKSEEKTMAERWATLSPQFVQAVDQTDEYVVFEDYFTKQTYHMPNTKEHFPEVLPWMGTIGLLEPINDVYYFNGMRSMHNPKEYEKQIAYVETIAREKQLDHDKVMIDYYPEILVAPYEEKEERKKDEKEVTFFTYTFDLAHPKRAEVFLYNDVDLDIKEWTAQHKLLGWVGKIQNYKDSELAEDITIKSLQATLEIEDNQLTFETTSLECLRQFLQKIVTVSDAFILVNDYEETHRLPKTVEVTQTVVETGENVPDYFTAYASMRIQTSMDMPIPEYNHQSIRQLMDKGESQLVETYLKNAEFHENRFVMQKYSDVKISPDFNTERKELGLPLSPFVTGGEERSTSVQTVLKAKNRETVVLEKDIPMYDRLGFSRETIDAFYTNDMTRFYQEKTEGKSKSTERKYRNSLYDIREIMERKNIHSWEECGPDFWENLLTKDIYELFGGQMYVSNTQYKELVTTVKAFVKWLSKEGKMRYANDILQAVWRCEEKRKNIESTMQVVDAMQRMKKDLGK